MIFKAGGFLIKTAVVSLLFVSTSFAQLKPQIDEILKSAGGTVGVGILGLEDREQFLFNESQKSPMQSVFKFPLAMAVLNQVDQGKLKLDQIIHVTKEDLAPKTWSPLREKYPEGNIDVTLAELIGYTVSQSDNNTCDMLFKMAGGPAEVNKYIHNLGVKNIAIAATEQEMTKGWEVQFTNWCQPSGMLQLLDILYKGKKLSKSSNDFLWKVMTETSTGPKQIKGLLPPGTIVAHKTGSSGTNDKGISAALNDVGIIALPNGKHIAVVVFVTNSPDSKDLRDSIIARISKASFDYFSAKK